jgi:hypothetical protein
MVCDVCGTRSSEGFCVACQKLLCEECGETCVLCDRKVCPECASTSRSGKIVCPECMGERQRKRHAEDGETTLGVASVGRVRAAEGVPAHAPQEFPEAAPPKRKPLEPWPWSIAAACTAILVVTVSLLTGSKQVPTVALVPAALGIMLGLGGLLGRYAGKPYSALGIVLNIVPFILALTFGVQGLGVKPSAEDQRAAQLKSMTEEQRFQLRKKEREMMLRRFQRPAPGSLPVAPSQQPGAPASE